MEWKEAEHAVANIGRIIGDPCLRPGAAEHDLRLIFQHDRNTETDCDAQRRAQARSDRRPARMRQQRRQQRESREKRKKVGQMRQRIEQPALRTQMGVDERNQRPVDKGDRKRQKNSQRQRADGPCPARRRPLIHAHGVPRPQNWAVLTYPKDPPAAQTPS